MIYSEDLKNEHGKFSSLLPAGRRLPSSDFGLPTLKTHDSIIL